LGEVVERGGSGSRLKGREEEENDLIEESFGEKRKKEGGLKGR